MANNHRESKKKQVIAIIGAGISGLLACKYSLSKGFDPIVFESESRIGGVWTKTIGSTKLQTPKPYFQFSDFPWPHTVTELYPHQQTVLEYIESYARHFDLLRHIQFNSKVLSINYEGDDSISGEWNLWGGTGEAFSNKGKWNVKVHDTRTLSTQVYQVDFVVVCVGRFSQVPNIPEFPPQKGPEAFEGEVIHSMDYSKMDSRTAANFVKGKHVAVVGFLRSGMDIARECSTINGIERPCTVVIRTPHWNLPDYFPWGLSLGYLYLNRFSELTVHKPGEGLLLSLLATTLSPLRWAFSKFVESYIKHKHRLAKHGMVPEHSFLNDLSSCSLAIVPEGFYDRVEEGSIKLVKKAGSFGFSKEGIMLEGQAEPIKSDLVILATGFKGIDKLKHIFESPKYQEFIAGSDDSAAVPLYRECIHPRIPQLAIIGFSESLANLYTSEIRCRWLAEFLDGKFKLPSIKVMEKDIAEWDKYKKRYSYRKYYRRSCIAMLHVWHNDQLCKDMGWNPKRKKGLWAEWFEPYGPMDYAG
ncbi:probable flavin-containing monooxygenase 1 isoform X2 [Lycium ferocissimum]|uniref:probable flavin-containing monooxygenase 1 isoform X2 n=1 Tax=Lycium ferocissimum TaxID=112874 RepID=UPI0028163D26|nr:probable flavin-containing monooxygenase 1 isoform X2 [Lycium ferocissimum]